MQPKTAIITGILPLLGSSAVLPGCADGDPILDETSPRTLIADDWEQSDPEESDSEEADSEESGSEGEGNDLCGNGVVDPGEFCDEASNTATCDADCTRPACGDGLLNPALLEQCDDGNTDDTDACTTSCQAATCGDGHVWKGHEACDGEQGPIPCTEACLFEGCVWDLDAVPLPVPIHDGQQFGQIDFDRACNLVVAGADTRAVYRLSRVDGSVTTIVENLPVEDVSGLTRHGGDGRIYFATLHPNQMWAIEPDDSLTFIADLPTLPMGMTIAPAGFGNFGGQIVWASFDDFVYATDPALGVTTAIGGYDNDVAFSDVAFGLDGTLYTVLHSTARILTLSPQGSFAIFADLPSKIDGLEVNPLGTALHIASYDGGASIDALSIPGKLLEQGPGGNFNGGALPTGMIFDAAGKLLYLEKIGERASINYFVP